MTQKKVLDLIPLIWTLGNRILSLYERVLKSSLIVQTPG